MNILHISIILPVYNVENYISDCLDSLLSQDIPEDNYEIICVNDGSTDKSAEIISCYAMKNRNIHLIKQENRGVSNARNNGLNVAKGNYIWFIDPDDFIAPNCLNFIIEAVDVNNADLFEISYVSCSEKTKFVDIKPPVLSLSDIRQGRQGASASGCIYVIKSKLLQDNCIHWNESLLYGEDYLFAFQVKAACKNAIFTNNIIYYYRQRTTSAMNSQSINKYKNHIDSMIKLAEIYKNEYLKNYPLSLKNNLIDRKSLYIQAVMVDMLLYPFEKEYINNVLNNLKRKNLYPYKNLYFTLKTKGKSIKQIFTSYLYFFLNKEWYFRLLLRFKFYRLHNRQVAKKLKN